MADSDIALLTEHFGYPPVSLLDDIINSVNELADRALVNVETILRQIPPQTAGFKPSAPPAPPAKPTRSSRNHAPPSSSSATANNTDPTAPMSPEEAFSHEIDNGTHQLETLLLTSIDRNFDKFELYVMQNILCIRPSEPRDWIRLGHYDGLDLEDTAHPALDAEAAEDGRPSLNGVRRLRKRLQASQQLNAMLHAEKARNEVLLRALSAVVGGRGSCAVEKKAEDAAVPEATKMEVDHDNDDDNRQAEVAGETRPAFGFLRDVGALAPGAGEKPLETTTAFALSQLQALRALSTSLRSLTPGLETDRDEDGEEQDDGRKSFRRQRMEYVETATRKHLETARGLELGKDGEVRDGEWQGEGRKLAGDEVESLEKAAALLGGAAGVAGTTREEKMDES